MKVYRTTVINKGSFKGWTSNLCSVKVGYKPKEDVFFFIKVWKQQSNTGKWLHPHFSKKQIELLLNLHYVFRKILKQANINKDTLYLFRLTKWLF